MDWTDKAVEAARESLFDSDDMGWPDDEATRAALDAAIKKQREDIPMTVFRFVEPTRDDEDTWACWDCGREGKYEPIEWCPGGDA